jgi:hypothetical protein
VSVLREGERRGNCRGVRSGRKKGRGEGVQLGRSANAWSCGGWGPSSRQRSGTAEAGVGWTSRGPRGGVRLGRSRAGPGKKKSGWA